jgi:hypothetical protein
MFCCFYKKNNNTKFLKKQKYDEYYNKRKNMYDIGNFKPKSVYYNNDDNNELLKIDGLCSLCDSDIHISIGKSPNRLIISYITNGKKDVSFHIYKFEYENIDKINDITQYHIYTAIQDYLMNNKNIIVAT